MRAKFVAVAGALFATAAPALYSQTVPRNLVAPPGFGSISLQNARVISGDTIEAWVDGRRSGFGLIGIKAPEANTPCGQVAIGMMWGLVRAGLILEEDNAQVVDGIGRRMVRVLTSDRQSLAKRLVRAGMAVASGLGAETTELLNEQVNAQLLRAGCVWNSSNPDPPAPEVPEGGTPQHDAPSPAEAAQAAPEATTLPTGFAQRAVVTGLNQPTAFAFAPDGRIFIAQKKGAVRLVKGGVLQPGNVIDISARVNDYWDHGLIGLALDPDFATNEYLYLLYTYENNSAQYSGTKTGRLARYTVVGDTASVASEFIVLGSQVGSTCDTFPPGSDCLVSESPSHSVGNLKFAADGTLFVSTGDGAQFNFVDQRALRAQNLDSLAGKVLRITSTGKGISTNPFYSQVGDPNHARAKIWAYGLRNPYRFNFRPGTSMPYVGDVGWDKWEEINVAPSGANLGWPCYEGTALSNYQWETLCINLINQGPGAVRAPLTHWSHNGASAASTGGAFYTGAAYPSQFQGAYFFGDYAVGFLKSLTVDSNNNLTGGPNNFATQADGPVDIQTGPDSNIYYLAINTGELRTIQYTSGNTPPTASAGANPTAGLAPLTVAFSSAGSSDPDGDPMQYQWNFGDGNSSTSAHPTHTYTANGTYSAVLTVTDGRGGSGTASKIITVGNRPPTATITAPVFTQLYKTNDIITYSGSATDPEDGNLPASALDWQVILHHCPGGVCHTHFVTSSVGASGSFTAADHDDNSHFEFILTATDSGGLKHEARVVMQPQTVKLRIETVPAGLQVVYGSYSGPAPLIVDAIVGGTRTLATSSPQGSATFASWSDGGAMSHSIVVPSTGTTYTATFTGGTEPGLLSGSVSTPSGAQNLTTIGAADWAHWGLTNASSFNRKSSGGNQISNYARIGTGTVSRYDNNPIGYTWTGGTPTASATNTPTGLYISGAAGNGFQITAPADATTRRLTVYVGVYRARGRLNVQLSDGSAPAYLNTSLNNTTATTLGKYVIDYRAGSPGRALTVTWTIDVQHTSTGNVTLQAAALSVISMDPDYSLSATPASVPVTAGESATYTVSTTAVNGFAGTVTFSASGLPSGANATFAPPSVTGTGSSTMTVTTGTGTPAGTYPVTITGVSGSSTRTASVSLTVNPVIIGGGSLTGTLNTPAGAQNLSVLGTTDWAHWGLTSATSLNRKASGGSLISDFTKVGTGTVRRYDNHPAGFTWTGGSPTATATNSPTGVYIDGAGSGYRITVPADTTTRRLTFYAGVYQSRGRLNVQLSDNSAPAYVHTGLNNTTGASAAQYVLDYKAASAGQTLTVTWTAETLHAGSGNVTLQAAALSTTEPDFTVAATPSSSTVTAGESAGYTVTTTALNGFAGTVSFSATGLPAGATATFNPASVTGSGSTAMTVTTGTTTPAGTYTLTVDATSGLLTRTATVTLVVNPVIVGGGSLTGTLNTPTGAQNLATLGTTDWAHWGLTSATSLNRKASGGSLISNYTKVGTGTVRWYNNHPVGFTWTGGTPTATATNSPTGIYIDGVGSGYRITVPADTTTRRLTFYAGVYQSRGRLNVQLSDNSAPAYVHTSLSNTTGASAGQFVLDYKAASAGQTLTVTWTVDAVHTSGGNVTLQAAALSTTEPDFTLAATPPTATIMAGESATYTATTTALNGFGGTVTFSATGLPAGANATFSPAAVIGSGSTVMTVATSTSTPPGSYTVTMEAVSGLLTRTTPVTLVINPVIIGGGSISGTLSTPAGAQNLSTLGSTDWAHWGLTSATSLNRKASGGSLISNYTKVGSGTVRWYNNHPVGFTWTGGTPTAAATNSPTGIYIDGAGSGFRITVPADTTLRRLTFYAGVYQSRGRLNAQLSDNSAPAYVHTGLNNTTAAAAGQYVIDYQAASDGQTLTVTWTSDTLHTGSGNVTMQAAALAALNPDFSLAATPPTSSVVQGASADYTVTTTALNGFNGTVTFSVTGLPAGTTAAFSPASVTGAGTATMTVTTTASTPAGSFPLAVQGVSGGITRVANVDLTVTSASGGGTITVTRTAPSGIQNLTTLGARDWAHWGESAAGSFNHKAAGDNQISNYTRLGAGTVSRYTNNPFGYTWTGGTPTAAATNTTTGLTVAGLGSGFRIAAPADTTTRTLVFFVGVRRTQGKLVAELSDGSAPTVEDTSVESTVTGHLPARFAIQYKAAAPNQTLTVTWTQNTATTGNITMQAAALQ